MNASLTKPPPWILLLAPFISLLISTCVLRSTAPAADQTDEATPPMDDQPPTYSLNAPNWEDGPPRAILDLNVDGLTATARGRGLDFSRGGYIASCSYHFGDNTPPVEVSADERGRCGAASHDYVQPGGYNVILAVWDNLGMIGQAVETIVVGGTLGVYNQVATHIGGCLEAYAWYPSEGGPSPTVVHYTPYQVAGKRPNPTLTASGVATLYVTNRGQGSSCDPTNLFGDIAQNDLLLIDQWLSEQPWSTGEYCLQGHSGPGFLGTLSSTVAPPGLKCALVGGADTKFWESVATKSGAWWPVGPMWIISTYGQAALDEPDTRIPVLIESLVALHGYSRNTEFFDERDRTEELRSLEIPVFFETSWDDLAWGAGPLGGPYLDVVQDMSHPGSAVIIYPGPHRSFDPSNERPYRAAYRQDTAFVAEIRDFLLSYLLGESTPSTLDFNYLYFMLKGGVQSALMNRDYGGWQSSSAWPPEHTAPVTLYLLPEQSGTIASRYDGTLSLDPPPAHGILPAYPYQPAPYWDPVYSSGGTPWRFYTFPDMRRLDQTGVSFTSPPLETEAVIRGPVHMTLTAETDLYDFDWMVILSDVWPDGSSHRISSGFLRASLRNNFETYQPRPVGQQTYRITLASIANIFQIGHRIRVTVHQVNSDDATPESRETALHLGPDLAELQLYADGGTINLAPYQVCADCDPDAVGKESLQAFLDWYVTGAVIGHDPLSGNQISVGFWARKDVSEIATGALLAHLPELTITAVGIDGIAPTIDPNYDHMLVLPNNFRVQLRCSREGHPGTVHITNGSLEAGPLEVVEGMIRCYDVPYVNW